MYHYLFLIGADILPSFLFLSY